MLIITLIILITLYFLFLLNKKTLPVLIKYVELEATKITIDYINEAIKEKVKIREINEIITVITNKEGEIVSVDFNTNNINENLYIITNEIQKNVKNIERFNSNYIKKENNVYYVPSGLFSGIPIISNLGPKIPIKIFMAGNVISNIKTDVSEYGINNVLLKVYIQTQTKINVVLPFITKETEVTVDIPIAMKVIQGKIPQVYGGLFSTSSKLYGIT